MVRGDTQIGWPTLTALGLVVVAFMGLSLVLTATGTARFVTAMGYDANVGYAVGGIFDVAKGILLIAVLALWARRASGIAIVLGLAWTCLVTFSWLATHATVSTAISSIERNGSWKMEARGNTKAELAAVEQQLAALIRPATPRPAKTVREALAAERVPASVWQDSQECSRIQESAHFARACALLTAATGGSESLHCSDTRDRQFKDFCTRGAPGADLVCNMVANWLLGQMLAANAIDVSPWIDWCPGAEQSGL
jgi:hypothetical protein